MYKLVRVSKKKPVNGAGGRKRSKKGNEKRLNLLKFAFKLC